MNKNKRINIVGLAQKLGLSVSSVSRALNGYDKYHRARKIKSLELQKNIITFQI